MWGNNNDLFLAARTQAGLSKISFHQSGIYRHAIVSKEPRAPLSSWKRPAETEKGITPIFDIVVPNFKLDKAFKDRLPPIGKEIIFLQSPCFNEKLNIRILLADTSITEKDLKRSAGTKTVNFHGVVPLLRETAWLVSYCEIFTVEELKFVLGLVGTTKINFAAGSKVDEDFTAQMHVFEMVTPPHIVDLPLGMGNVHIEEVPTKRAP